MLAAVRLYFLFQINDVVICETYFVLHTLIDLLSNMTYFVLYIITTLNIIGKSICKPMKQYQNSIDLI